MQGELTAGITSSTLLFYIRKREKQMTVLVFFEDLGVALSDVLLSREVPGGGIPVPSIGDPALLSPPLAVQPTQLVRKFFRIQRPGSEGVFLGCGTVSSIKKVFENVDLIISRPELVPNELRHRFNANSVASLIDTAAKMCEAGGKPDFELLGLADGVRIARAFNEGRLEQCLPYWGHVLSMGSGAPMLMEWLRSKGELLINSGLVAESIQFKRIRAMHNTPLMLLNEDIWSQTTLNVGVGGYYETFLFDNSGLTPAEDTLSVFGSFIKEKGRTGFELHQIFYHLYDGDYLIVGALLCGKKIIHVNEECRIPLADLTIYPMPPMKSAAAAPEWNPSRLALRMKKSSRFSLNSYRGPKYLQIKRFYEGEEGRRLLRFDVSGSYLSITLHEQEFLHFLSKTDPSTAL
jgi:hypothetical protein